MNDVSEYLPSLINNGRWLTAHSLNELQRRADTDQMVLPVCSLGTPVSTLEKLAPLVLPPLYHESMDDDLKSQLLPQIEMCFPFYEGTKQRASFQGQFDIVELPPEQHAASNQSRVVGFSVDTAVEEHGPHLPLMTDTIQSYGVLNRLCEEFTEMMLGPPVEYGQLTWGLPFGMSIDVTPSLLTRYVANYTNALLEWLTPAAIYVVDVHGSIVHRTAIQEGLKQSRCENWAFRWLHEPLVEFAGERGDQHAGGVETSLVHYINPQLVDANWWPDRVDEIADGQMTLEHAIKLSPDLPRFIEQVEGGKFNGIVGDVRNFFNVDAALMMDRMLTVAREDIRSLIDAIH